MESNSASDEHEDEIHDDLREAVISRYAHAYLFARTVRGIGGALKGAAYVIGALSVLLCLAIYIKLTLASALVVFSGSLQFLVLLWIAGVLISAFAENIKVNLDRTVFACPFMTKEDMAEMLSLTASVR